MKLKLLSVALAAVVTGCGGGSGGNNDTPEPLPQNTAPVFESASADTLNGDAVDLDLSQHASDADGDALSIASIGEVEYGTLTTSGLIVTYDPEDSFAGSETVDVTLTDGTAEVSGSITFNAFQQVVLSGQVVDEPIPGAIVTVSLGGQEFQAVADANGNYLLEIQTQDLDNYVKVSATGGEGTEGKGIALVSLLGEIGSLIESAGDDRTVGGEGETEANVTNVTTARYVLAVEANGGEEISSDETMAEAEKSIDADELLEVAAVIKVVLDNPDYSLPEGVSDVVELVTNAEAYNTFVAEVTSENPEDNALTQAMDAIVKDPALVQGYTAENLARVYYGTFPAAPGFLSRGGDRYQFNADGSGSVANEQGAQSFTWQVTEGEISVTYDEALTSFGYYSAEAVLGVELASQWFDATGSAQIGATRSEKSVAFTRLVDGQIIDTVSFETVYDIEYDMLGSGIAAPNEMGVEDSGQMLLRDAAASEALPIVAADLEDSWAVDSYYTYQISTYEGPQAVTGYAGDLLEFVEGGTGSAALSGRTFTWELVNNEVQVTFNDGTVLAAQKIDEAGELSAFSLRTFNGDGELLAFSYNFGTWQDEATGALTTDKLVTEDGFHWATFVNGWITDFWEDGAFQYVEGSGFGWEFNEDGTSNNVQFYFDSNDQDGDGNTDEILDYRLPGTWSVGNDGVMSVTRCPNQTCRQREWLGLQATEDEIVILERESFAEFEGLAFPPRINIYRKWQNPQVDWAPQPASSRVVAYPTMQVPGKG